jgi:hypothetical protein
MTARFAWALLLFVGVQPDATSARAPLGFFGPTPSTLARLDPLTLEPAGPQVPIGEYHRAAILSPDGVRLAVATGGPGGGIQIVDVERMEILHSVHTGIAAEALAWLTPDRVLGALQCNPANSAGRGCGIVLVDGVTGKIVRRWPETENDTQLLPVHPPLSGPKPVATTRHGVVFLLGHAREIAAARLVLITKAEEFRSVSLSPIQVGLYQTSSLRGRPLGPDASAGLAVDPAGERAFVVGAESTVAEIDLSTMNVRYHEVTGLERRSKVGVRRAFWLPDGGIAVFGYDLVVPTGDGRVTMLPAGVRIIDTMTWRARTIDAQASTAALAAGSLLVYGGELLGVTAYNPDGRERFRLFGDEQVREVYPDGAHAYVVTRKTAGDSGRYRVRVISAATGTLIRETIPSERLVDLISREP